MDCFLQKSMSSSDFNVARSPQRYTHNNNVSIWNSSLKSISRPRISHNLAASSLRNIAVHRCSTSKTFGVLPNAQQQLAAEHNGPVLNENALYTAVVQQWTLPNKRAQTYLRLKISNRLRMYRIC